MRSERFEVVFEEKTVTELTQILRDTETGVQYLFRQVGVASGMTVLLGADGLPAR